jgi:serine/threonine protein kinase
MFTNKVTLSCLCLRDLEIGGGAGDFLYPLYIVVIGVAVGMAFQHSQQDIHRDLTLNNVLLDHSLEPRISDFGLAKFIENGLTISQSNPKGTVQYMTPEIFHGEQISTKVDVYPDSTHFRTSKISLPS